MPRESTRGLEIVYENGALQVRIMNCSTRGEYELPLQLAGGFGRDVTLSTCPRPIAYRCLTVGSPQS
jgi:hypothetical protein